MEKDRRIRRYRRKDYRELVEFPVEIVGRDGAVRRYDFEESVRLYQRRLHFAPTRFGEEDLVTAEQGHCRARIDQLRHSYFVLFGWQGAEGPHVTQPVHAGELVSFLQRALRCRERLDLRFARVDGAAPEGGEGELWFMERPGREGGFLLYCYAFEPEGDPRSEAAFTERLRALRAANDVAGDAERLVAWRHAQDCGFVLTGRAEDVGAIAAVVPEEDEGASSIPTPWDEAVQHVRRGDLPTAFLRCRWIVDDQPWHRDAYVLGMSLALTLRRAADAEDLGFIASAYAPDDPLIRYYLALAQLSQGRYPEAERSAAAAASAGGPPAFAATTLLVWTLVLQGAFLRAWRALRVAEPPGAAPGELDAQNRESAHAWLTLWWLTGMGAVFTITMLATAIASGGALAWTCAALAVCATSVAAWRLRGRGRALHQRLRLEDPRFALKRIAAARVA